MLYRYIVNELNSGILVSLDSILDSNNENDLEILFRLTAIFEDELPIPDNRDIMVNTISYFTRAGNRKFHKAIKKISLELNNRGYTVSRINIPKDIVKDYILYEDKYQVVLIKDWEGSTTSPL